MKKRSHYLKVSDLTFRAVTKKIIIPVSAIMASGTLAMAQTPSNNQNYIHETKVRAAGHKTVGSLTGLPVDSANHTIQYFDGLGRPIQSVQWQASPGKKDIVQIMEYDAFGREAKKYLPYSEQFSADGTYKPSGTINQNSYYSPNGWDAKTVKTASPFNITNFEASPLNRVIEQGAPGTDWQPVSGNTTGHTVKTVYGTNATNDVLLWQVNASGATATGYYTAGRLHRTVSMDENWVSGNAGNTEEFKDFEGRLVLRRLYKSESEKLNTYYIYDDFGNLRYVVPPAVTVNTFAESDSVFGQFIYGYHYDGRRRVVEKKIPGKGWEYLVYNKLDQLVYSQDENQRNNHQWIWTKYDALGHVVLTGLENGNSMTRQTLQNDYINMLSGQLWESRTGSRPDGYTVFTHPMAGEENTNIDFLTMSYYDDYNFPGYSGAYAASVAVSNKTRGLITGGFVRILGSSSKLLTVTYYDEDGRVKETIADNAKGGKDRTVNSYNFVGELTSSVRTHEVGGTVTTILSDFAYDHVGRKHSTTKQINNGNVVGPNIVLDELVYNEIGQLSVKKLHNSMQSTAMAYNERGWLKSIISDQFSIRLDYQENGSNQYNGNISKQFWSLNSAPSASPNVFSYGYDKLNRLTSGISTGIYMSEVLNYDVMGNINQLSRNGGLMNQYYYNGNRLDRIDNVAGSYVYDTNGNATTDGRTGMVLSYNHLNLPSTANGNGKALSYVYDARGSKLRKTVTENGSTNVREYIAGIEYDGNGIDIIHTEEGIAQRNGDNSYTYHYNLTDHLGNVRYTFDVYNGLIRQLQSDDYFPFGKRNPLASGNNKYLYNGKEVQDELGGQLDYGARFYDPEIGRWNVVDPLAEKDRKTNPYAYGFNNPISVIDPDGMEGQWIPSIANGKLTVTAEKGDNAETLQKFLGVSQKQANAEYKNMKDGKITLSDNIDGVTSINAAVSHANKNPESYAEGTPWYKMNAENYNCYECAISTSKGETPRFTNSRASEGVDFKDILSTDFTQVTTKTFGKTVMSFNEKNFSFFDGAYETPIHAATYLGTSKNGTIYTWSKNGFSETPKVLTQNKVMEVYDDTYKIRFYNPKR